MQILSVCEKVQVGKDQEKAQSEKDSHSKNRGGKKTNHQSGNYTMETLKHTSAKFDLVICKIEVNRKQAL